MVDGDKSLGDFVNAIFEDKEFPEFDVEESFKINYLLEQYNRLLKSRGEKSAQRYFNRLSEEYQKMIKPFLEKRWIIFLS